MPENEMPTEGLEKVLQYMTSVPAWYLATSVDGQPHVRPFSFAQIQDGKLWFVTATTKDVWQELLQNQLFEATSWWPGHGWLILRGKAGLVDEASPEMREAGWQHLEGLGEHYDGPNDKTLVFFSADEPQAWICDHEETPASFTAHMRHYANLKATLDVSAATETENVEMWTYGTHNATALGVRENSDVDIYAYYPYVEGVTDLRAVPFTTGQDDWMWAKPARLTASQTAPGVSEPVEVPLQFSHVMTCIEVRIRTKYNGSVSLTSMTLTDKAVKNRLCSAGTFNAMTGDVTQTETGNELTIRPGASINTGATRFYLMFPEVTGYSDNEFELSFVFNNIAAQTTFPLPTAMRDAEDNPVTIDGFHRGTKYIYELMLDNTMHFEAIGTESD